MHLVAFLAVVGVAAALPQGTSPASSPSPPPAAAPKATNPFSSLLSALGPFLAAADLPNSVSNDLVNGTKCKDIIYIVARGSEEPGNMGISMGPAVCKALKKTYADKVACQGISKQDGYSAGILDNMIRPKGTSEASISATIKTFKLAHEKCPAALLVFSGYSQGAAVMHSAVGALPEDVKKATIAGVLFGSTKNKQENAQIKNYPKEQVASFCVKDDGVCWGKLDVTGGHLAYLTNGDSGRAAAFLQGKIDQALKGKVV